MYPIQARQLQILEEARSGHVGAEHALFNNLVSVIARGGTDFGNLPILTKDNTRFGGLEINRATPLTGLGQRLV